jgi:7,8-dihydro-6-hydroxymethylpterin dimethyltransferase
MANPPTMSSGCCGGSCGSGPVTRPDRPHVFFAHAMTACAACGAEGEGRVVFRDGQALNLLFCVKCGERSERLLDADAGAYMGAFLAKAKEAREGEVGADVVLKQTTSTCPKCLRLLVCDVVIRAGRVYFVKDCPDCGPSQALASEDADYYVDAYRFAAAGTEPLEFTTEVKGGCPTDCGTCNDHEQHTCLPIVEITDYCNLECPVCIVNNQYANHMSLEDFGRILDRLIAAEGFCESVALSGGEPTSHPQLLEMVAMAAAKSEQIGRVVVITNGLRLGQDRAFAQALKDSGAYVALQLDGFSARSHEVIRGKDLTQEKAAAIEVLKSLNIPTQLIFVAVRGVNEHELGQAVELLLSADNFLSLNFQPVAHTGLGGGAFAHDPMDRLTIPGVISRMAAQAPDVLRASDFAPLPCSHPQCVSLTYLLKLNDGSFMPFSRFIDGQKHGALLRSSATLVASPEIEDTLQDVINDVYAREFELERGDEILAALKRCVREMFPGHAMSTQDSMRVGEGQAKSIFLHHYMDAHDFDLERLRKCCHHYALADDRIMPACGFNMFHRGAAKGADTALPSWGKKGWDSTPPKPKKKGLRLAVVSSNADTNNGTGNSSSGCGDTGCC